LIKKKIQSGGNKKEYCLKKIHSGRKKKDHDLKKYNLEERRKTIVLKNTIWKKEERPLS